MSRDSFINKVIDAGWVAYEINPTWIKVTKYLDDKYYKSNNKDRCVVDILHDKDLQINLFLPTRFGNACPGRPGQLRLFRVIAYDWNDAFNLIKELYDNDEILSMPFDDVVLLTVLAARLIPDDMTYFMAHRGKNPGIWKQSYKQDHVITVRDV